MIHEILDEETRQFIGVSSGSLFFAWVVPISLLGALLGIIYIKFFLVLPRRTQVLFITSFIIFFAGAVGMEMIGGNYISSDPYAELYLTNRYIVFTNIEEFFEMVGLSVFIYTLLDYASREGRSFKIEFTQ